MKPINKAIRRAKQIPLATNYKEKQKAVHAWFKAIKELLAN
jgi:hypothetical protein